MFKRLSAVASVLLVVLLVAGCGGGGGDSGARSSSSSSTASPSTTASERSTASLSSTATESPAATETTTATETTATTETAAATESTAGVKRFEVTLSEFAFSPNTLEVNVGDQVEVVVTNNGNLAHDFRIDALNVNSGLVQAGETKTITFTASQAGEFEIYCNEAGHKPAGMTGTLKVVG